MRPATAVEEDGEVIVERSPAEIQLLCWLEDHRPELACSLDYCVTVDDMRKILNQHTGLDLAADVDRDEAFGRYLEALKR